MPKAPDFVDSVLLGNVQTETVYYSLSKFHHQKH